MKHKNINKAFTLLLAFTLLISGCGKEEAKKLYSTREELIGTDYPIGMEEDQDLDKDDQEDDVDKEEDKDDDKDEEKKEKKENEGALYFWYNQYSENEKKLYDEVLAGIQKGEKKITLKGDYTKKDSLLNDIYYDHPELFWYTGTGTYWSQEDKLTEIEIEYNDYANNFESNKKTFEDKVNSILAQTKDADILQQERKIHDYLASHITYEKGPNDQSAYSGIVEEKTVCAGYTRAYQYLMHKLGIPVYYCWGECYSEEEGTWESHGWDIVQLEGNYYNVDVTWDDPIGADFITYAYYHITDKQIEKNHRRKDEANQLPKCTSTDLSYENIFKESVGEAIAKQYGAKDVPTIKSVNEYIEAATKAVVKHGKGTTDFFAIVPNEDTKKAIEKAIQNENAIGNVGEKASTELKLNDYQISAEYIFIDLMTGSYLFKETIELN